MKTCSLCWQSKPLGSFYAERAGRYRRRCKRCVIDGQRPEWDAAGKQDRLNREWLAAYATRAPGATDWRPMLGYEGLYEVSSSGRVRSLWFRNGKVSGPRVEPHELATSPTAGGYYLAFTAVDWSGRRRTTHVHTAVLEAFRGRRPARLVAGHRNGDSRDNQLENLDWITHQENEADKRRHGRRAFGSRNSQAKLTEDRVREMRELRTLHGYAYRKLARLFGVSPPTATRICQRQMWRHVL